MNVPWTRLGAYAVALAAGAGAALVLSSSDPASTTETSTVIATRTVVRTVTTHARTPRAAPRRPQGSHGAKTAPPAAAPPTTVTDVPAPPKGPTQRFSGTGPRKLGSVTVRRSSATLRWTNSGGSFRLLFNGGGVAVDSAGPNGSIQVPAGTYTSVEVRSPGRWTIELG